MPPKGRKRRFLVDDSEDAPSVQHVDTSAAVAVPRVTEGKPRAKRMGQTQNAAVTAKSTKQTKPRGRQQGSKDWSLKELDACSAFLQTEDARTLATSDTVDLWKRLAAYLISKGLQERSPSAIEQKMKTLARGSEGTGEVKVSASAQAAANAYSALFPPTFTRMELCDVSAQKHSFVKTARRSHVAVEEVLAEEDEGTERPDDDFHVDVEDAVVSRSSVLGRSSRPRTAARTYDTEDYIIDVSGSPDDAHAGLKRGRRYDDVDDDDGEYAYGEDDDDEEGAYVKRKAPKVSQRAKFHFNRTFHTETGHVRKNSTARAVEELLETSAAKDGPDASNSRGEQQRQEALMEALGRGFAMASRGMGSPAQAPGSTTVTVTTSSESVYTASSLATSPPATQALNAAILEQLSTIASTMAAVVQQVERLSGAQASSSKKPTRR